MRDTSILNSVREYCWNPCLLLTTIPTQSRDKRPDKRGLKRDVMYWEGRTQCRSKHTVPYRVTHHKDGDKQAS